VRYRGPERRDPPQSGMGAEKLRILGPFLLQLVMIVGGYYALTQQVKDLEQKVDGLQAQIVELRGHVWKSP
jgi:hypothetical protein